MRLEIESTVAVPPVSEEARASNQPGIDPAEIKSALNNGIKAAQAGNRSHARTLLMSVTDMDPRNESAWLWLSSISEYPEELLGFLNHVLGINPENPRAIEWKAATLTLLSKTFVQRGIDACQDDKKGFAAECFQTALEHDGKNATALMWMASLSDSNIERITLLENAIALEPDNAAAIEALEQAKKTIRGQRLAEAKTAAVSGDNARAIDILDNLLLINPESIEAWTMKSYLADGFDEKIRCFESILAIDPYNLAANTGRDSLLTLFGTVEAARVESAKEHVAFEDLPVVEVENSFDDPLIEVESTLYTPVLEVESAFDNSSVDVVNGFDNSPSETESEFDDSLVEVESAFVPQSVNVESAMENPVIQAERSFDPFIDKSPTQDLEMPAEFMDRFTIGDAGVYENFEPVHEEKYVNEQLEPFAEPLGPDASEAAESTIGDFETVTYFDESVETFAPSVTDQHETSDSHPAAETVAFRYDFADDARPGVEDNYENEFAGEEPAIQSEVVMPIPYVSIPVVASSNGSAYETSVMDDAALTVHAESFDCPFCGRLNDPQTISCNACMAVLTLSDLELLLANQNANKLTLRRAVESMERNRTPGDLGPDELTILGLGHLNLRNLQTGFMYLSEASQLSPNNVVLSGQVNSLHIRLEEIKQQEEAHLKMPKGKSILVVDDSETVRRLIASKLEKCGHDVVCANDGVEAMERLDDFVPDLILLDIMMPRMDGYQVCKNIRSKETTKDVPVIMISGKDGFFDKVRGRLAGTTGFMSKPFGPETLMKTVEMYLSGEVPELDEV